MIFQLVLQNPFLERHYLKEGLSNYVVQRYFQYMKNIIRLLPVNLTNEAKIDLTETLSTEIELFRVRTNVKNAMETFIFFSVDDRHEKKFEKVWN